MSAPGRTTRAAVTAAATRNETMEAESSGVFVGPMSLTTPSHEGPGADATGVCELVGDKPASQATRRLGRPG